VKPAYYNAAVSIFGNTGLMIAMEEKRHLGAALGTDSFVNSFVTQKVSVWKHKLEVLSEISVTQPHAAYAAFTHEIMSRWNYLIRCIPDIGSLLCPLEEVIRTKPLPNLTGQCAFNDVERDFLSLPPRFGGLGL